MDEKRLQEIEARANDATPGPWTTALENGVPFVRDPNERDVAFSFYEEGVNEFADADMHFIAHARADVPDLVAEVRRLTAALATARREGAAEMRERAAQACIDEEVRAHDDRAGVVQNPHRQLVDLAAQEGRARAACTLRFRIAALPLDAPGGAT